jgi:hypothetical protein
MLTKNNLCRNSLDDDSFNYFPIVASASPLMPRNTSMRKAQRRTRQPTRGDCSKHFSTTWLGSNFQVGLERRSKRITSHQRSPANRTPKEQASSQRPPCVKLNKLSSEVSPRGDRHEPQVADSALPYQHCLTSASWALVHGPSY